MSICNPRIHVSFRKSEVELLTALAAENKTAITSLIRELVLEALEKREKQHPSKHAEKLNQEGTKTVVHDETCK